MIFLLRRECSLCETANESAERLLFACPYAADIESNLSSVAFAWSWSGFWVLLWRFGEKDCNY